VNPETGLAAGYAAFLLAIAVGLDRLARHAHNRSDRYRTAGFRYHPQHDAWVCPREEWLWPAEFDRHQRLVRYRARPSVCNACPVKADCTTSPHGREVVRAIDPWPHSEAGRFHRGIAVMLIGLADLILLVEVARHHTPIALAVLAAPLALTSGLGWRFLEHLRHTPTGFPDPTPSAGLRLANADRAADRTRQPSPDQSMPTGRPVSCTRWGCDSLTPPAVGTHNAAASRTRWATDRPTRP
jgi:hypothetical protein